MDLGKLERGNLRDAWPHEAHNFTPWLADNLDHLAAELGIDALEREGTEVTVGPYRADIVARMPQDGSLVLIENQLERANLQHLGQMLADLAGLKAKTATLVYNEGHAFCTFTPSGPSTTTTSSQQISCVFDYYTALQFAAPVLVGYRCERRDCLPRHTR